MDNFKPIKISGITTTEKLEMEKARRDYEKMCDVATDMKTILEEILQEFEELNSAFFMEFINSDPEKFIKTKFIEMKQVSVPGLKVDNFDLRMLDIDPERLNLLLSDRKKFDVIKNNTVFEYDLENLFKFEDGWGSFSMDIEYNKQAREAFETALAEKYTEYTVNEKQNQIFHEMQALINSANNLIELGFLHGDVRFTTDLARPNIISLERSNPRPLSVSRQIFKNRKVV
jgi:hypothetical protein